MRKNVINEQVNLKTIIIKHLKYNFQIDVYINNSSTFTENLIIIYTIIHELSGTKQREHTIENILYAK